MSICVRGQTIAFSRFPIVRHMQKKAEASHFSKAQFDQLFGPAGARPTIEGIYCPCGASEP
jgi:hypothetical protein